MLTVFKNFFTEIIYSISIFFNSYVITYIIFAILMAFFGAIYSIKKSKNDKMCTKFAPYVRAVQVANIDRSEGDNLLSELYSKNHFNAFPVTLLSIFYVLMCMIIFPSLLLINGDNANIPVNFLWIENITTRTTNIPMIIIYAVICVFSRNLNAFCFKKIDKKRIITMFIQFMLIIIAAIVGARMFSCLFLIYSAIRLTLKSIIVVIYKKSHPSNDEIIVSDRLKELRDLVENNDKTIGKKEIDTV